MHDSQAQRMHTQLIGEISLSKYTYKQTKALQQLERTTINSNESRSFVKFYQITLPQTFPNDTLITGFQISLNHQKLWNSIFEFGNAQASSISIRGHFVPMNNIRVQNGQKFVHINAHACSQSLKLYLNLKKDFYIYCEDMINLKKQKSKQTQQQNITKVLTYVISSIKIYGYNLHTSPPATQLTKLLNMSLGFKKNNRSEEQAETDILLALCLINARRFVQASQILRKTSNFYVTKYNNSKSHLDSSKYERSWMKQYDETNFQQSLNMSRNYSTGRVLEGTKYLFKAAKIQLLLAQTISHPSLRSQKLEAYNRSNSYFNGNPNPSPLEPNADIQEVFFKIGPNLIVFLMKVLYDKTQILRITALKSIEFIYQTIGCSLSQMIPQLLKTIIVTYPSNQPQQNPIAGNEKSFQSNIKQKVPTENSSKSKILIDNYHHLLQTFISLLPLMNKKCLRSIFKDIIVHNLASRNSLIKCELKLYLLRFSQKILSLCLSDLDITTPFLSAIVSLSEKKICNSEGVMKYTVHNLSFFSQRIIQVLKVKILPRYNNGENLVSICSWINENLVYFCQNQLTQENSQFFSLLVDFVAILYVRTPVQKLPCPIEPIIYFLNMSINQLFLPFENLLNVTIILLKFIKIRNNSEEISRQIVERIIAKSKIAALNIKELKILESILKTFDSCEVSWMSEFLNCIPHSTFDEIYSVFSILFQKTFEKLSKKTLQKIINTLIDQYTVKGKAHESAKNEMIDLIKSRNPTLAKNMIEICLTQNDEPIYSNYQARKKRNLQHTIDSKMYKVDYQSFVEKLQLSILFLSKKQNKSKQIYDLLTFDFIKIIYFSLKKLLESKNSKIKQKALKIIKNLSEIVADNIKMLGKLDLFYAKAAISLLKSFIVQQIESKLQYQAVSILGIVLNEIFKSSQNIYVSSESSQFDFMDGNIESSTEFEVTLQNLQQKVNEIRFRQFVKMYPALINLLNSPWENIKELIMETIIAFFSKSLLIYSENYQKKAIEVLRPLITNYIHSQDYSERFAVSKLIGCLIGLSRDYSSREQMIETFSKGSKHIKFILSEIYALQEDWHQNTNKTAKIILQVSLTNQEQQSLKRKIQNWKKTQQMMENSYCTFNLHQELNNFENKLQKNGSTFSINNFQNFEALLKDHSRFEDENKNQSQFEDFIEISDRLEQEIGYFKSQILKSQNLKTSFFGDKESFLIENEEDHYFQPIEDRTEGLNQQNLQNKSEELPLEFEDLGIIDLDDQEWGEEENEVNITQKLPLKKIYKLSPNIGTSTKHLRIRSKRYFSHEFDPNDKIIVDELEGRINHQSEEKIQSKPIVNLAQKQNQRYESLGQSQQFEDNFQEKGSPGSKVESKRQLSEERKSQRNEKAEQKFGVQQRQSGGKKTKKTTTKKRKSSILK